MAGAGEVRFEEASVKRTDRCALQNSINPGRISLNGDPLKAVLMEDFKVKMDQIAGPAWLDEDCFAIAAKMSDGRAQAAFAFFLAGVGLKGRLPSRGWLNFFPASCMSR